MERITNTHVFFWGSEFSNWYPIKFYYAGGNFANSEQAFMWEKAKCFGDKEIATEILNTPDPKRAKALGRKIKNFDAERWSEVSYDHMVNVNLMKYAQNPRLRELLLSTGDKTLVEASPVDLIWGIGIHWEDDDCLDESNWKGQNLLGKALMEVRKLLNESIQTA